MDKLVEQINDMDKVLDAMGVIVQDERRGLQKRLHDLQKRLQNLLELQAEIDSCTGVYPMKNAIVKELGRLKAELEVLLIKERHTIDFREWCIDGEFDPDSAHQGDYEEVLLEQDFPVWEDFDPLEYPGLNAMSGYILCMPEKPGNYFDLLPPFQKKFVKRLLDTGFVISHNCMRFFVGKPIGDRWTILFRLSKVAGSFNEGIYVVSDERDESGKSKGILKVLPTETLRLEYAHREIDVQARLKHPNIVEMYDANKGESRHESPWMVTEYCDKGTLGDLVRLYRDQYCMLPELFIWQVMLSLACAVQHCHQGPAPGEPWDTITHRDVILHNIFIQSSENGKSGQYPYTIKLGDWGCGVTQSEWTQRQLNVYDLPCVDLLYEPPETALPTEATDMYQIGVVLWCLFCREEDPPRCACMPCFGEKCSSSLVYSTELRDLIFTLLHPVASERLSPGNLIDSAQHSVSALCANGRLPYIDLLITDKPSFLDYGCEGVMASMP